MIIPEAYTLAEPSEVTPVKMQDIMAPRLKSFVTSGGSTWGLFLRTREMVDRQCAICGGAFKANSWRVKRGWARYCSHKCAGIAKRGSNNPFWKPKVKKICPICEKPFEIYPHEAKDEKVTRLCSKRCFRIWRSSNNYGGYSRIRGGRRKDLGDKYFRSRWEANYARYLNWLLQEGKIQRWEYEAETFEFIRIIGECQFYTPDFKVIAKDGTVVRVEIKGWMDRKSKIKQARMKKYYPDVQIDLVGPVQYYDLAKRMKATIQGWELDRSHGI